MDVVEQPQIRSEFMPLSILRAIWKRKILIVAIWLLVTAVGAIVVYRLPAVYQARAVILIEQQRIPERYVLPTVNEDLSNRLNRISQQILAYEPLLKLIEEFNLYEDERQYMVEEEIVERLRKNIRVSLVQGWAERNAPAFQIVFEGEDPSVVAQVSNRLSTLFIDENLRTRANQALGTSEFLTSQLEQFRADVERQEDLLREYRMSNMGELPEQERVLLSEVQRLQSEINRVDADVERGRQNKLLYENTLASARDRLNMYKDLAKREQAVVETGGTIVSNGVRMSPEEAELRRAQEVLAGLQARYSESHPDVRRVQSQVDVLTKRVAEIKSQEAEFAAVPEAPVPEAPAAEEPADPSTRPTSAGMAQAILGEESRIKQIEVQMQLLDESVRSAQAERQQLMAKLSATQSRLGRIPLHEQELSKVSRDYQSSVQNYQSLLEKRIEADLASELETRQKSEKFTVLEPARLPERPIRPDRELLMLITCGAGLFAGCLLGFGAELRSNVLLGEWELPPNVTVLGQVPLIEFDGESEGGSPAGARVKRSGSRLHKGAWIASSVILSLVVAVATSMYFGWISF